MGKSEGTVCAYSNSYQDGIENMADIYNITQINCIEDDGGSLLVIGGRLAGDASRYAMFAILLFLGLVTIFGNIFVIECVVKSRRLHCTNYSVYVVSLALSDMFVGAICLPAMALYTVYGYWPLGSAACTTYIVFDFTCCSVSNMHLVVIAYDRFRAVADPLAYVSNFTKTRARKLAFGAWMCGALYYIPGVIAVRILDDIQGNTIQYQCSYPTNAIFLIGIIVNGTYGPTIGVVIMYILLMYALKRRHKSHSSVKSEMKRGSAKNTRTSVDLTSHIGAEEKKISGQNRRSLATVMAQIILFLICWIPWMVVFPVSSLCETCIPPAIYEIAYWMVYLNSTLNPTLYFAFNKDYRNALRALVCCDKRCL